MLIVAGVPIVACILNYFLEILPPHHPWKGMNSVSPTMGGWNPWNLFILPFPVGFLCGAYAEKLDRFLFTARKFNWIPLFLGAAFLGVYFLIGKVVMIWHD